MQLETALDIRLEQRKQYLENPNFERLSDIIKDEYTYRGKRDNYLFLSLLDDTAENRSILIEDMEEFFLENYKRPGINWKIFINIITCALNQFVKVSGIVTQKTIFRML